MDTNNRGLLALKELQDKMEGQAEQAGLKNEDDIVAYIKQIRDLK